MRTVSYDDAVNPPKRLLGEKADDCIATEEGILLPSASYHFDQVLSRISDPSPRSTTTRPSLFRHPF